MADVTATFRTVIYGTQENALIGFRHAGDYGQFRIVSLEVISASPVNASTSAVVTSGSRDISRITAVTGGVDVAYVKLNGDAVSLPSQVLIRRRPENITLSSVSKFRRLWPIPTTITGLALKRPGLVGHRDGTGTWWSAGGKDAIIQAMLLQEGEGMAINSSDANPVYAQTYMLSIYMRNPSTSDTYIVSSQLHPSEMAGAGFAILNGTGSGISLEIMKIEVSDIGDPVYTVTPPLGRLARIFKLIGGKDITPIYMDRNDSTSIPSGFLVVKRNQAQNDLSVLYNNDVTGGPTMPEFGYPSLYTIGAITTTPYIDSRALARRGGLLASRAFPPLAIANPNLITNFFTPATKMKWIVGGIDFTGSDMGIICNKNEGIAFIMSNNSSVAEYYVEMTIAWTPYASEDSPIIGEHLITTS